jgi:hypothetical protein
VNPSWEGLAGPRHREVISPELALVDPVLAASARASLPERRATSPEYGASAPAQVDDRRSRALTALSDAALAMDDELVKSVASGRSWRALIGVAAVTVLSLLLFDVRVQVGKTPASAETPQELPSTTSTLGGSPRASVPRHEHEVSGESATKPGVRRFAWAPAPGASGYHIEFFKGAVLAFSANTTRPELIVPALSKDVRKTRSLVAGEYRWYVWPVISGTRAPRAIVQTKLVVR